jgi:hypothetical protein
MMPTSTSLGTIALCMWRATAAARMGEEQHFDLLMDMVDEPRLPESFRKAALSNIRSVVFRAAPVEVSFPSDCEPDFGPDAA